MSGVNKTKFIDALLKAEGNFLVYDGKAYEGRKNKVGVPETIANVDAAIKKYLSANGGKVDYVHGEKNLQSLVESDETSVGVTFDALEKSDLFGYVAKNGSLPRKTFSMGEGVEKRYYLEGRMITDGEF